MYRRPLDHRGIRTESGLSDAVAGSLDELARIASVQFPQLSEARRQTENCLEELREALSGATTPEGVTLCMMGLW